MDFLSYIHYSWWNHNLSLSTVLTRVEENSRVVIGQISVNMLGVCDMNMRFVYVLTGWEGFDVDSRVPRDIINHSNGLRVLTTCVIMVIQIVMGFLTPYKGVRYNLSEWSSRRPQNSSRVL
ncbi:hypothetical protein ACS0TY_033023 [Phlomoides rotata]